MPEQRVPRLFSVAGGDAVWGSTGMDPSEARYARNFYPGGQQAGRRRRGMRVVRAISSAAIRATDAIEFLFPTLTRRIYKHDTTLYEDTGSAVNVISTGWGAFVPVNFIPWDTYLIVYQNNKRVILRESGGTIIEENFDLAAASAVGVTVASSATAGALVAGNTHLVYIVLLNANTGRQSGPIGPFTVTIAAGQTSYDINTLPAAPADPQYTHFKLYRSQANLTAPFFSQQYAIAAAGTLVNDGVADAALTFSDPLPISPFTDFYVGIPPNVSQTRLALAYRNMIIAFDFRGNMRWTEPGTNHRWSANVRFPFPITAFDVTAAVEAGETLVVATGREIFSGSGFGVFSGTPPVSDFRFRKESEELGVYNSKCLLVAGGATYGLGPGGVFTFDAGGVRPMKQTVRPDRMISSDIYFSPNTTGVVGAALGFDPRLRILYASIPIKGTVNSQGLAPASVVQTYPIDEPGKVGWFDMQLPTFVKGGGRRSFIVGGTDHGRAILAGDSYGNILEIDFGENDGIADTAAYNVDAIAGAAPATLVTVTPNPVPGVMPARGVRVVGLPADPALDPVVGTVTATAGADITIADFGAAAAVNTTMYLGGILGWYETGALLFDPHEDGGLSDRAMNALNLYLHDLVYDESDALGAANQPHVIAQLKVDGGNWGPRVTVYDGTAYPDPGKVAATLTGKVEAGGKSKGGTTFRLRFLVVVGNKPARPFAYEPGISDSGRPKKAGG